MEFSKLRRDHQTKLNHSKQYMGLLFMQFQSIPTFGNALIHKSKQWHPHMHMSAIVWTSTEIHQIQCIIYIFISVSVFGEEELDPTELTEFAG